MRTSVLRNAAIIASTLLFATSVPLLSRYAEIGSLEAVVKEAAVVNLPRPEGADGVVVTSIETLPEALTGVRLTGNKVVLEKANGQVFTVEADPNDVARLATGVSQGITGSAGSRRTNGIQFEMLKWATLALVILNVANAFFKAIANARRAFASQRVTRTTPA